MRQRNSTVRVLDDHSYAHEENGELRENQNHIPENCGQEITTRINLSKTRMGPNESKVVSEIHELLERYGPTFVDLAVGKRFDMDVLLEFYGAPLRFIGPTFHMIMNDNAAITGPNGMGHCEGYPDQGAPRLSLLETKEFLTANQVTAAAYIGRYPEATVKEILKALRVQTVFQNLLDETSS